MIVTVEQSLWNNHYNYSGTITIVTLEQSLWNSHDAGTAMRCNSHNVRWNIHNPSSGTITTLEQPQKTLEQSQLNSHALEQPKYALEQSRGNSHQIMRWNSHTFSRGCSSVNYGCSSAFLRFTR